MSATADRIAAIVAPLLEDQALVDADTPGAPGPSLYDIDYEGGVLRVVLDRPGGLDVATLSRATRAISAALDEADPIDSSYTLEVSSPGIERKLRTPEHFAGAVGEKVQVKVRPGVDGERRALGTLRSATANQITLQLDNGAERSILIDDITRAQVHKDWTPAPKPGAKADSTRSKKRTANEKPTDPAPEIDPKNDPTTRSETTS